MPKRTDLKTIMIIGAGPIVIGQACEFDYSGVQACKALREEGYRVVLINSNPATIMTDPDMADATYIEPVTAEFAAMVIEKERPDALLPTMGGQTALNVALELSANGTLEKYNVELIGANEAAINKAEDRQLFRDAMDKIGLDSPKSFVVNDMPGAWEALKKTKLPAIIRPSFTLAGTGGGIAYNREEFETIVSNGLKMSPVTEVLVEESVLGWKEYEMEVVRDKNDNCIIICSIENIDPMGVHTGDSITVAPALTLTDKEYQIMRDASLAVLREIGVETGGSNVQFAFNPANGRMTVIEMNPRVSRSSALASKATGFPIARVAAKLAVGYTLDELQNDITPSMPAAFEPTIDYIVVKAPRFAFEKLPGTPNTLTTSMKSVGEAMAIGRSFAEAFQKALRSLETGQAGLHNTFDESLTLPGLLQAITVPTPDRMTQIADCFWLGATIEQVHNACKIDPWFLREFQAIVETKRTLKGNQLPTSKEDWLSIKQQGFSDTQLGYLTNTSEADVRAARQAVNIRPVYKRIDTCAAEFRTETAYMYGCYEYGYGVQGMGDGKNPNPVPQTPSPNCEAHPSARRKVIVLGSGPNRIGQGIEFDYCCVHAAFAAKELGIEAIMVNCNPETVSTDYDTSDRLYFEPLTAEDVLELCHVEQQKGTLLGVVVQYGGQTPLKLADELDKAGIPILGTPVDALDLAEDRERFQQLLQKLNLKQPENRIVDGPQAAINAANEIGYPVVVRPSFVLGGRAMEIAHDEPSLRDYMVRAVQALGDNPILIDQYLQNAVEVDVDAISDGTDVAIMGIMEHIEEAGIHSGDSACSIPPYTLSNQVQIELQRQTRLLAEALGVVGLMNVQYAVKDNVVYLLEVNPRASRTVPFVAKANGVQVAKIAAKVMMGERLSTLGLGSRHEARGSNNPRVPKSTPRAPHIAVKEAVFPFARFPGVDTILGPEMKSTGEVMGADNTFARAFAKAQIAAGNQLPLSGKVFLSVKQYDKELLLPAAQKLAELGFELVATAGTADYLQGQGVEGVTTINKVAEGRPHIVDAMKNGEIDLVINTTEGVQAVKDSFSIRRTAVEQGIVSITTVNGARAVALAIEALRAESLGVRSLQDKSAIYQHY